MIITVMCQEDVYYVNEAGIKMVTQSAGQVKEVQL